MQLSLPPISLEGSRDVLLPLPKQDSDLQQCKETQPTGSLPENSLLSAYSIEPFILMKAWFLAADDKVFQEHLFSTNTPETNTFRFPTNST